MGQPVRHMTTLTIIIRPLGHDRFEARLEGRTQAICVSHQPLLDAARALHKLTLADANAVLQMKHEGRDDVAASGKLADLAKWRVSYEKSGMRFRPWSSGYLAEAIQ